MQTGTEESGRLRSGNEEPARRPTPEFSVRPRAEDHRRGRWPAQVAVRGQATKLEQHRWDKTADSAQRLEGLRCAASSATWSAELSAECAGNEAYEADRRASGGCATVNRFGRELRRDPHEPPQTPERQR